MKQINGFTIVNHYTRLDRTLILGVKRDDYGYEYVVADAYGTIDVAESWAQGHYFRQLPPAIRKWDEMFW